MRIESHTDPSSGGACPAAKSRQTPSCQRSRPAAGLRRRLLVTGIGANLAGLIFGASSQALPVKAQSTPAFQFNPGLPLLDGNNADTGGAEPSIRVDTQGHVYVDGPVGVPTGGCPAWRVHPDFLEPNGHAYKYLGKFDTDQNSVGGGDCDIATGGPAPQNGFDNLALSSLNLANLTVNQSSDGGDTFRTAAANPFANQTPADDRQWQSADSGIGENYLTVHDLATDNIQIATSTDGGFTYTSKQPAITTTPGSCGQPTGCLSLAIQDNHFGNIVVNKTTHQLYTIYVAPATQSENLAAQTGAANEHVVYIASGTPQCAGACAPGNPIVNINWTDHIAYTGPSGMDFAHIFPVIAIDAAGTVYASWSDTQHIFMTHSATPDTDGTFSAPIHVDQIASHSTMFPWLIGGQAGVVDAVWYSAQQVAANGSGCGKNSGTDGDSNGVNNNCHNTWTTQFAQSLDGGGTFTQAEASTTIHNGSICDQGLTCNTNGGDRTLLDYFQVDVDPAGAANIAFASDVGSPGTPQIEYTRQCTGHSATQATDINFNCASLELPPPPPPGPTCEGSHVVTDPAGDASSPLGTPSGAAAGVVDITNVAFSNDATTLTTTMTIANLPTNPPPPLLGTTDTFYYVVWTAPNGKTYATRDVEPDPGTSSKFRYGEFDTSTNALKTSNPASGVINPGTPGTISITVPRSGVGNPTIPVSSGTPAVTNPFAFTDSGYGALGTGLRFVRPDDRAPNAGFGSDWSVCGPGSEVPPSVVPEAPAAGLITLVGVGAGFTLVAVRRRRRHRHLLATDH